MNRIATLTCLALLCLPHPTWASVVSRLGAIYFYDPLSFDAGALVRGATLRGGASDAGALVDTALLLPFYHEMEVYVGYHSRLILDAQDQRQVVWRLRAPIQESARFGTLSTTQILYAGSQQWGDTDPTLGNHELGVAFSRSHFGTLAGHTLHGQLSGLSRPDEEVTPGLAGGRAGVRARGAWLFQLYEPRPGPGGKWTVTLSGAEFTLTQWGAPWDGGGEGSLEATAGAPAAHFSHRTATYSLGLLPMLDLRWGAQGPSVGWSGQVVLHITYRNYLE